MHITIDDDEFETVTTSRRCTGCDIDGKCRPGRCNGSFSLGSRRRSWEEIAKIKADRNRAREDGVLAEAEAIKLRRRVAS